ncbi:peptidoglycan editing factor PgeF [Bacillus sp. ISL-47]|uniref:peptidoglycan editing factor PgeF n=1 Tax=Bacillus sp. ISL-47 TaxID=2819130 RepID=UPI001BE668EC|nr:peptidoglycan editing factor PgeF [Bacillus sp. ISL-47]MBT2687952.1 peptidoglycan editing factor PgeF [Bacillus sp. ISL-47]MBT2708220.1 peptidoglycan editing factor PgeF [Pseudomonas sp. ISL-84]
MEPFSLKNREYFVIKEWTDRFPNITAGFTTKNGGCSQNEFEGLNVGLHVKDSYEAVSQNRKHVAGLLGFSPDRWVGAEQTHEVRIQKVSKEDQGKGSLIYEDSFPGTDGFFTYDTGVLLTLCYADCVPLYFLHEKTGAIGIAHAGWKGTVEGIGKKMAEFYRNEGIDLREVQAVIGPSICENCYIVDDRVISKVQKILEDVEIKPYNLINDNQYHLDLKKLNMQILLNAGILEDNILITEYCTSCDKDYFFSHRRDKGRTGRMMSFIGWKEEV